MLIAVVDMWVHFASILALFFVFFCNRPDTDRAVFIIYCFALLFFRSFREKIIKKKKKRKKKKS